MKADTIYGDLIGKFVVVRNNHSGIWLGQLVAVKKATIRLKNARRAWRWEESSTYSGLASHGSIEGSRIAAPVGTVVVFKVCEMLETSKDAIDKWASINPWVV